MATYNGTLNALATATESGVNANASSTRPAIIGYAASQSNIPAVQGWGSIGNGVYGRCTMPSGGAVAGENDSSSGYGVYGISHVGLYGDSNTGNGIGVSGTGYYGVYGVGTASGGAAILGIAGGGFAGDFTGNVHISGNLVVTGFISKGGGGFLIDHPLDQENQVLEHSFVESPDRKNVYDGVATADDNGEATIELPAYFEALNGDFRYQATAMGAPTTLFVKSELNAGRFTLAGAAPGQRLCWQVTGIRKDAWALANPMKVERKKEPKP